MTSLSRIFKKNITIVGGKGSSSGNVEHQKQEEQAARKREDEARRLLQEADQRLEEEARWQKEEEEHM